MDFSIPAFSSGLLVVALSVILCFLLFSPKHKKLPPGPFNLPLIGALPLLGSLPHISLLKLSKTYGDIMYMKIGTIPLVVISSGRLAKELYKQHGDLASSRPKLIAVQHLFKGLGMTNDTTEVKYYRKIVTTHLLSARMLKINEKVRHQEHLSLVSSVLSEQGRPFKLIHKLHEMNMNIAGRVLLGKRFYGGESKPELDVFKDTLVESMRIAGLLNISDVIPALRWLDLQGLEKQCKQLASKINQHLASILEERKISSNASKTSDGPLPFIDTLISLDSTEEHVPDEQKLVMLMELLLASIDTSAVSAEWAMTELFKHPKALERVSKEIQDVVGNDRLVEESDLSKLPVVEAIAKETLRLHPPAPLALPKIALEGPTQLAGYTIPRNAWVYVNFYAVGTDSDYWEDPLEFRPERFLDHAKHIDVYGQDFNLLPFGSGRRVCLGAKLGFDTLQTAIAMLVHGFEWEFSSEEMDMGLTNGLVCHKTQPLVAAAKPKLQCLL